MTAARHRRRSSPRLARTRHTRPERVVRSVLHAMGYRFRVHEKDLPGTPDVVFRPRRKVIFVHGCFWHDHHCRPDRRRPRTNVAYWNHKFARNTMRHARQVRELEAAGWAVLTVWECELEDTLPLALRLRRFLGDIRATPPS